MSWTAKLGATARTLETTRLPTRTFHRQFESHRRQHPPIDRMSRANEHTSATSGRQGYSELQAKLHDINKVILGAAAPHGATSSDLKAYDTPEHLLMEEDAHRGEQIAREQAKLQTPRLTQTLYPEEPPSTGPHEPLTPIHDFNTSTDSPSKAGALSDMATKISSSVGHAATKITAAMGLGGPRTHPSEQASSTAEAVRDDHTPGASHRLKTANLETLADPVELKHKLESYPLDEDAKREVVGAIQARNYLYAGLGPKEKASDKAMQMLDDSRRFYSDVPNQGVKDAVKQDVVKSAGHSNDKIAKPIQDTVAKAASMAGQVPDKADDLAKEAAEGLQNIKHQAIDTSKKTLDAAKHAAVAADSHPIMEKAAEMTHKMVEGIESAASNLGAFVGITSTPSVVKKKEIQLAEESIKHPQVREKAGSLGKELVKEKAGEGIGSMKDMMLKKGEAVGERSAETAGMVQDKVMQLGDQLKKGAQETASKAAEIGAKAEDSVKDVAKAAYYKAADGWEETKDDLRAVHAAATERGPTDPPEGPSSSKASSSRTEPELSILSGEEPSDFTSWDEDERRVFRRSQELLKTKKREKDNA